MTLHIPNLNTLIAHLEAQPPERINMAWFEVKKNSYCGTAGCIGGHIALLNGKLSSRQTSYGEIADYLNLCLDDAQELAYPPSLQDDFYGVRRYPAHRVIATLKRLRDRFITTGEIVVDWGPEPGEEPTQPWRAPQAVEIAAITPPALPESLTRILAGQPAAPAEESAR